MDNDLKIIISAKDSASETLKRVKRDVEDFGDSASKFLGEATATASRLAAVGLLAVGAAAVDAVKSFSESENVQAQLNAVLESTHRAAGLYIEDLNDQAAALQKITKFSDESVGSVQALLLTFTDLSGPVIQQATGTVLDMATALGEDTKSASIQLGKALQDPILGITALRRVGVNFNDAQKEVIANLVNTGQKAKAQQLILKELNTEFGGSAVAAGKTFSGQLTILGNKLDDVKEKIGDLLVYYLAPLVEKAGQFLDSINWEKVVDSAGNAIIRLTDSIVKFSRPIVEFVVTHKSIIEFMEKWGITALAVIPALAGIGAAIAVLTNPLVLLTAGLAVMWELWEKNRVLFWTVIAVLGPLAAAFLIVRTAMMIGDVIETARAGFMIMNTAVQILTGTNIAAAASAGGLRGAVGALQATVAVGLGPLTLIVVGIAAIIAAVNWVNELHRAWDGANAAAAYGDQLDNTYIQKVRANPNLTTAEKNRRIQNVTGGARAAGGPVEAGKVYMTGEGGRELFVPKTDGTIIPNDKTESLLAGNSKVTQHNTFNVYNQVDPVLIAREMGWALSNA